MSTEIKRASVLDTCRVSPDGQLDKPLGILYQQQTPLVDDAGRVWTKVFVSGAEVSFVNPFPVGAFVLGTVTVQPANAAFSNSGPAEFQQVTAGGNQLIKFTATNLSGVNLFLQWFDSVTPLAGGEPPYLLFNLPANTTVDSEPTNVFFGVGIQWAISTTATSYTAVGSNDAFVGTAYY